MSQLHKTLQSFYAAIFEDDNTLARDIIPANDKSGSERLNIYRRSITGIQTDALVAIYPTIQKLTGEVFFRAMCGRFIRQHPSPSGDLHHIGEEMPEFLRRFKPAAKLSYLPDTARLEWLWHKVFHESNCEDSNLHELVKIPEEKQKNLVFTLRPASALLKSEYPILQIWDANQDDDNDQEISLDDGKVWLIISRIKREMIISSLDEETWKFILDVSKGKTLEKLSNQHKTDSLLPLAVQNGWITHFVQG